MDASTGYPVAQVVNATEKGLAEAVAYPHTLVFFTSEQAASNYSKTLGGSGQRTPAGKAGGQAGLNTGTQVVQDAAKGGWQLSFGNTAGLLGRILKVGFGGILIVAGVMIMFPKVNEGTLGVVTKVAGKVPLV